MSKKQQKHWDDGLREELQKQMHNQTRADIIVGDALNENLLGDIIGLKLCAKGRDDVKERDDVKKRDDALDSLLKSMNLSNRARLAYLLGIIPGETMQDLQQIRIIRNHWAHRKEPTLSDNKLKKSVSKLSTVGQKQKNKVTEENYMDFCKAARIECWKVLLVELDKGIEAVKESENQRTRKKKAN